MAVKNLLMVWWDDAASKTGWQDPEDVKKFVDRNYSAITVGFEISQDESALVMSATTGPDGLVGDIWRIPVGCIKKKKLLKKVEV